MNIKHAFCAALFAFAAQACMAQTSASDILTTSGGYGSNALASLSWTIGETLIETGSSTSNFLTQGFEQPSSIVITSIDNTKNPQGNISAYPNPVISSVYISSSSNQPLRVDVMDLTGRKLFTKNLSGNDDKEVNMTDYSNGMYLLRVYNTSGQLLQTLKVDKIK